jgi:hypothetical protein
MIAKADKLNKLSSLTVHGLDTQIEPSLYNVAMLEGRCTKCGCYYTGCALLFVRNQVCSMCGGAIEVFKDGKRISEGYSPFTAEKYYINLPPSVPTPSDETGNVNE